jgi:hypothetical protein
MRQIFDARRSSAHSSDTNPRRPPSSIRPGLGFD